MKSSVDSLVKFPLSSFDVECQVQLCSRNIRFLSQFLYAGTRNSIGEPRRERTPAIDEHVQC